MSAFGVIFTGDCLSVKTANTVRFCELVQVEAVRGIWHWRLARRTDFDDKTGVPLPAAGPRPVEQPALAQG